MKKEKFFSGMTPIYNSSHRLITFSIQWGSEMKKNELVSPSLSLEKVTEP